MYEFLNYKRGNAVDGANRPLLILLLKVFSVS